MSGRWPRHVDSHRYFSMSILSTQHHNKMKWRKNNRCHYRDELQVKHDTGKVEQMGEYSPGSNMEMKSIELGILMAVPIGHPRQTAVCRGIADLVSRDKTQEPKHPCQLAMMMTAAHSFGVKEIILEARLNFTICLMGDQKFDWDALCDRYQPAWMSIQREARNWKWPSRTVWNLSGRKMRWSRLFYFPAS